MDEHQLVSCIVPVFNAEPHVAETLDSILSQTHRPIEVIAVDDGSADASAEVIARYAPRVLCVRQANRGEAAARNAGIRMASGAFLAFLDADDLWHPHKLARQLARFDEHPDIDLSFTQFQNFWDAGIDDEAVRYQEGPLGQPSAAWSIGTVVTRRALFERFGPFDEAIRGSVNMTWFLRVAERGARVDVLPEVLMRRRLHARNLSRHSTGADWMFPMVRAWRDYRRKGTTP